MSVFYTKDVVFFYFLVSESASDRTINKSASQSFMGANQSVASKAAWNSDQAKAKQDEVSVVCSC